MSQDPTLALTPSLPADRVRDRRRGMLLMVAAVSLLSLMDVAVKLASASLSTPQIAWGRYVTQLVALFAITGPVGLSACLKSRMPGIHVLRALLLLTGNVAFMLALRYLPLAEANVIGFASPLLLTALSYPVLREAVGARRWAAVGIGFVGVLVVMRPGSALFQWAALLPLLMAVSGAFYHVLTPVVQRRQEDPAISIYYLGLIGAVGLSLALPWFWETPGPAGWAMLVTIGCLGTVGHLIMIRAFALAPAAALAPFFYVYLVWAIVFGVLVFGDVPGPATLLGAALVVASGAYVYRQS